MSHTTLMLFGKPHPFRSEKDAYLRAVEALLTVKPALLTEAARHVRKDRARAPLFAPVSDPPHASAGAACHDCYAETCLNNDQKVRILDRLARYTDLKRGTDWDWQAEDRPTRGFIDTKAMVEKLRAM